MLATNIFFPKIMMAYNTLYIAHNKILDDKKFLKLNIKIVNNIVQDNNEKILFNDYYQNDINEDCDKIILGLYNKKTQKYEAIFY